jgi:hypothetical protein
MRFFNRSDNPNLLVGIFLLMLLAVFIGPNILPRIISSIAPGIDESIPCAWLRRGTDRAYHQSLIGRAAVNPLRVQVRSGSVPNTPDGTLSIAIVVVNESLGTVPIVYDPNQVIVGDNNTSGLGLIFNPPNGLNTGGSRFDQQSFPEENIRLLGPRQRCIHRAEFPASQLDVSLQTGTSQVRAFYRINTAGGVQQTQPNATPIYPDQGLDIVSGGYVESAPVTIPLASQ